MKSKALRIGLIGSGDDSSNKLLRLLAEQGMQVVHALLPSELTEALISATDLDVWLLDLDDSQWHDQLDELMDRSSVPIFFNEHQAIDGQQHLDYWCRNLISRMFELVADVPGLPTVVTSAPAPVRAESAHIAFPNASLAKKTESKPSDELTPAPAALDPKLLQEIEELEQLLQTSTVADSLLNLDDEELLATPAKIALAVPSAKPALASATPTPASTPAPAAPATIKPTEANTNSPVSDAVTAAKERAAKIKQQFAAKAGEPRLQTGPVSHAAESTTPTAVAQPDPVTAVTKSAVPTAELLPPSNKAAEPVRQAPVAPPVTSTAKTPVAPLPVSPAVPVSSTGVTSKTPANAAATLPPVAEPPSVAETISAVAKMPPPVEPPEKFDWPEFPKPAAAKTPEPVGKDFAPMQPQPAAGPMREPGRPLSIVQNSPVAAASAKASEPSTTANRSQNKTDAPEQPSADTKAAGQTKPTPANANTYFEPVPTLALSNTEGMEFEDLEFEPAPVDETLASAEWDVPMLETVASAGPEEFEAFVEPPPALPCDLWVLGASLGGPAALKRFFTALDQPLPICFLLAQHIDAHFLPVLGKILEQANPFYPVQVLARPGLIEPGSLLLAPIEKRLRFLEAGQIVHSGKSWTPPYSPSIDDVLGDVAAAYPGQVHAIVFSGMGEDGVNGARTVRANQGQIWVQEPESCASSVMPDAIHQANLAHYRASPEQLAIRLMARYRQSADSKNLA